MVSGAPEAARTELPVGTVTLLLADIEGSTRLWQERPDDMPAAIAKLDAIVDATVAAHNGVRPVEQGEGDSFVVAFVLASDAVACALALQQATTDGLLRLRIGVHTGEVHRRNEGNYIGPAINRTARIRDAGHGGQTLLSQTTADIVADQLPAGASLLDLGERRLRDLDRSERIHQLAHPDLRAEFPPLRALEAVRTNLPAQLSSFVGRSDVVAAIRELLAAERAITLTGAGGCGKTRLALQVAAGLTDDYEGVWLVDFAPLNDHEALTPVIAEAVGATVQTSRSERAAITEALGGAPKLLLFDNCEHIVRGCAELADYLLRACPALTILSTSREPLGLVGEVTYRVPSLDQEEAVALFAERAARANARFTLDDANAEVVTEICQRLDGIPLAIELAAARLRVFTPTQIREGLHDRFRLLTGGARTAVPRQQTLQASVDWSYALLLEPERALLHRLSVFAGGFTLEAAQSVGAGGGVEAHHVLDLLGNLVEKSLVVADGEADRFRLLETIRQYAAARLVEGGDADAARQAHFDFYFGLTRRRGESVDAFNARIDADYDNVRRALQWAEGQRDPAPLVRLAARLYGYWALGRRLGEGLRWLELAVGRADTPQLRSRVLGHYAHVVMMVQGAAVAEAPAREAVALARELGGPIALAWALGQLGNVLANVWDLAAAEECLVEAAQLAADNDDAGAEAFALFQIGRQLSVSEPGRAQPFLDRSVAAARRGGADYVERMALAAQGMATWAQGDTDKGLRLVSESLAVLRDSGDRWYYGSILTYYALILVALGRDEEAERAISDLEAVAAVMPDALHDPLCTARGVQAFNAGRWDDAIALLRSTDHLLALANLIPRVLALVMTGDLVSAEAAIEEVRLLPRADSNQPILFAQAVVARASGDATSAEELLHTFLSAPSFGAHEPIHFVEAMKFAAALAADDGAYEFAVRVLAATHGIAQRMGLSTTTPLWRVQIDPLLAAARAALGDARVDELWAQAVSLTRDELQAYVQRGRGERKRATTGWASITKTEHEVIALVVDGLSNPAIAEKLFMSVATVKSHLTHVYAKLGVSSRTELAAAVVARGLPRS